MIWHERSWNIMMTRLLIWKSLESIRRFLSCQYSWTGAQMRRANSIFLLLLLLLLLLFMIFFTVYFHRGRHNGWSLNKFMLPAEQGGWSLHNNIGVLTYKFIFIFFYFVFQILWNSPQFILRKRNCWFWKLWPFILHNQFLPSFLSFFLSPFHCSDQFWSCMFFGCFLVFSDWYLLCTQSKQKVQRGPKNFCAKDFDKKWCKAIALAFQSTKWQKEWDDISQGTMSWSWKFELQKSQRCIKGYENPQTTIQLIWPHIHIYIYI